jgi:hypothetical protein
MEKTVQSCPNVGFNDTALKIEAVHRPFGPWHRPESPRRFKRADARLDEIGRGDGQRDVCCNGSRLKV